MVFRNICGKYWYDYRCILSRGVYDCILERKNSNTGLLLSRIDSTGFPHRFSNKLLQLSRCISSNRLHDFSLARRINKRKCIFRRSALPVLRNVSRTSRYNYRCIWSRSLVVERTVGSVVRRVADWRRLRRVGGGMDKFVRSQCTREIPPVGSPKEAAIRKHGCSRWCKTERYTPIPGIFTIRRFVYDNERRIDGVWRRS